MEKLFAGIFLSATVSQLHAAVDFYDSFNYSPAGTAVSTAATPTWSLLSGATDPKFASLAPAFAFAKPN